MKPLREVLEQNHRDMRAAVEATDTLRTAALRAEAAARRWQEAEQTVKQVVRHSWKLFFLTAVLGGFAGGGLVLLYFLLLR